MNEFEARKAVGLWLELRQTDWPGAPTRADAEHSALLTRLLSGKKALPKPPPLAFAYPWYDIVETGKAAVTAFWVDSKKLTINQNLGWAVTSGSREDNEIWLEHPGAPGRWRLSFLPDFSSFANAMLERIEEQA